MDTNILLSFIGTTVLLALLPGPDNIFVLIQSVTNGVKYGIATVLGLVTGCIVHTALVAFGVSALIKENEIVLFILKLFGAAYLLYLSFKVYKTDGNVSLTSPNSTHKSMFSLYKQGFVMNVLNPKVSLFFLAFFPSFLFSNTLSTLSQFFILGFIFMTVTLVIFSGIAILAGSISKYLKQNANSGKVLKWLQIIVFIAIAIFILFTD